MHEFIVLDTKGLEQAVLQISQHYTEHPPVVVGPDDNHYTAPPPAALTPQVVTEWLAALIREMVDKHLYYRQPQSATPMLASALYTAWPDDQVNIHWQIAVTEALLTENRVDMAMLDVETQVFAHIGKNEASRWREWRVISIPGTLTGLVSGEDYRIQEFHRLQRETSPNSAVDVSIASLVNYLQRQILAELGQSGVDLLPMVPAMVMDVLVASYPRMCDVEDLTRRTLVAYSWAHANLSYQGFLQRYVRSPVDGFVNSYLSGHLDALGYYEVYLTSRNELLIYPSTPDEYQERREMQEIRQSLENGDYVPESERRQLAVYERRYRN